MSRKKIIVICSAIFFLIAIPITLILFIIINSSSSTKSDEQAVSSRNANGFENTSSSSSESGIFLYGTWGGNNSLIKAVDIVTNNTKLVATLPQNIKKVNTLSPTQLIYINETNVRDHGTQIINFNIPDKKADVLVTADEGFGIDDYVLSPNKKYLAVWEVAFAEGSNIFHGGRSRVYGIDLARPEVKILLYDEVANAPVHYPQAVTDAGYVFADKFLPNDPNGGAGWAYGVSVVRYDGSEKQDLNNMQEGTFGTQPFLSPNGKLLAFAGYDGSKGDGKERKLGYRRALLAPNTIEILDTTTLKREKLRNFPNSDIYSGVDWGTNENLIITILSKEKNRTGLYSYSLKDKSLSKINLPKNGKKSYSYVAQTPSSGLIMGSIDESVSSVGNLGDSYIPSLTRAYFQPRGSSSAKLIAFDDSLVQFISILPNNYFEKVLGATTSFNIIPTLIDIPEDSYTDGRNSLQLRTFLLPRENLTEIREEQQSDPIYPTTTPVITSRPLPTSTSTPTPTATPTPTIVLPANQVSPIASPITTRPPTATPTTRPTVIITRLPTRTPAPTRTITRPTATPTPVFVEDCTTLAEMQCAELGYTQDSEGWDECVDTNKEKNRATRGTPNAVCSRSPLYLYGPDGLNVEVKILTTVYNDFPSYDGLHSVRIRPFGLMEINNSVYQSIRYDYLSNLRFLKPPTKGTITKKANIGKVLRDYAKKFGLNEKETTDLVNVGTTKIESPYVFISFFDQDTSENILPLSFNPKPDNYHNIVFYFKQLGEKPNYTPEKPVFPPAINRSGFTAVEVSEIIE